MYDRIRAGDGLVTPMTRASAAMKLMKITQQTNILMQSKVYVLAYHNKQRWKSPTQFSLPKEWIHKTLIVVVP